MYDKILLNINRSYLRRRTLKALMLELQNMNSDTTELGSSHLSSALWSLRNIKFEILALPFLIHMPF